MKKQLRKTRRALALILSIVMLLTTLITFNVSSIIANAAESSYANVHFSVPEAIYLTPTMSASTTQTSSSFQWYVDSTVDKSTFAETLSTGEKTTGNVFFEYGAAKEITLSYSFVNTSFTAYPTSGTVTLSGDSSIRTAANTYAFNPAVNTVNATITAGNSPAMSSSENGCYIEWKASYTDLSDGLKKCAYAYTYVYKPNVQPVAVALRNVNENKTDSYAQNISWISGIHKIGGSANYYPNTASSYGFIPFASSKQSSASAGGKYFQFPYLMQTTANNDGILKWLSTSSSAFTARSVKYATYESSSSFSFSTSSLHSIVKDVAVSSTISVDSSRYSNLKYIPNLTLGMMVTDDESSKYGAWYVSDDSSIADNEIDRKYTVKEETDALRVWDNHGTVLGQDGTPNSPTTQAGVEGVKFNSSIDKAITTSATAGSSTFMFKTAYCNLDGSSLHSSDTTWNYGRIPLNVYAVNKAELRSALNYAKAAMAKYGVSDNYASASGYTQASMAEFASRYKAAATMLITLDKYYTPSQITSAANGLISAVNSITKVAPSADYSKLNAAIQKAESFDADLYTAESWAVLETALDAAKKCTSTDQTVVDSLTAALNSAINGLCKKEIEAEIADYSALDVTIATAEALDKALYTAESWSALNDALNTAKAVDRNLTADEQVTVDAADATLKAAIDALVYKSADYTALDAAIATAESLSSDSYTAESWAVLEEVLSAAKNISRELNITEQTTVDRATDNLVEAMDALEIFEPVCTHEWGNWYMSVNPTATQTGLMKRDCKLCEASETMIVPTLIPTNVTGVSLGAKSIALSLGDFLRLEADVKPDTALNKSIIWTSTDPSVVTVNSSGRISAVGVGVANIIVRSEENPNLMDYCMVRVASLVTSRTESVIDNENGLIYGLSVNLSSLDGYVDLVDDSTSIVVDSKKIGTGTDINIVRDGVVVDTYQAVVFGDATGDSWYDGMDSVVVNLIANGMLDKEDVGEAVWIASDCNHDGVIDELDVSLLEQAGLLLTNVDQTKTAAELKTDSAFIEYTNLIAQNPDAPSEITEPTTFFEMIVNFIKSIFEMIVTYIGSII